jgi:hypothetical protein
VRHVVVLSAALWILALPSSAQRVTVAGCVRDLTTAEPLASVGVTVRGTAHKTTSDSVGFFHFAVPATGDSAIIILSRAGHMDDWERVVLRPGATLRLPEVRLHLITNPLFRRSVSQTMRSQERDTSRYARENRAQHERCLRVMDSVLTRKR